MADDVEKIIGLSALNHYNDKINSVIDEKVGTGGLTIDSVLSDTSTNPAQSKAIKAELDKKADKTDIPTSLPANGGNADTVNGRAGWRVPTLTSSGALWDASAPNINDACIQWDESNQYFKIKTLGGNNIAVDFADTIDGKHASEFAVSLTNLQFGSNRIAIPDSINVGEWLVENAKSGNQYFISTRGSRTNLPDVSADWMWFSYDGNRYYARAWIGGTDTRDFVLNYVNSTGGWKELITSSCVTGTSTIVSNNFVSANFGFTPSAVLYAVYDSKTGIDDNYRLAQEYNSKGFITETRVGVVEGGTETFSYIALR